MDRREPTMYGKVFKRVGRSRRSIRLSKVQENASQCNLINQDFKFVF
jgi:hypothetical protein